jgi:hypothetical protein
VGLFASLLLAINYSFIKLIKYSATYGFSMPAFSLGSLLFFKKYHDARKNLYFNLGMLSLGIGYNVKGYFAWFILALFLYGFVYACRHRIGIKTLGTGFLFFLIGAAPILFFQIISGYFHHVIAQKI